MSRREQVKDHCLMYFPGNFMWSQGVLIALGRIPFGAAEAGEIFKVAMKLKNHVGDNERWFTDWTLLADDIEQLAIQEEKQNHYRTAGGAFLRASNYHFIAERYLSAKDSRKLDSYEKVMQCFQRGIHYLYPQFEKVNIPYEGKYLPAYFLPGRDVTAENPGKTIIGFGGLDSCKESTIPLLTEFIHRNINCLMVDGPGQGESLRVNKIPSRFDYEVPASAAYDFVAKRRDVDSNRIGLMALSMGGYYAPRAAAFEHRFKVCVAWGAHFDYHSVWVERRKVLESGGTRASAPNFQLPWVLGVETMDEAMKKLQDYTLEGVADKIDCPILIFHGENDSIVPVENAYRLYEHVGSRDKTLKIATSEEGGSEHIGADNLTRTLNYLGDWISDHL